MRTFLTLSLVCLCLLAIAQPGVAEMQQAQQDLNASFFSAFGCCMILAVLFGLCGALRIYHNLQLGKEQFDTAVSAWFFASFFMLLAAPFLRALFGI